MAGYKKINAIVFLDILIIILFISGFCMSATSSYGLLQTNDAESYNVNYLIITKKFFTNNVEPLAIWKTQKGLYSEIVTIEDIEEQYIGLDTAEKIRNCIKQYHDELGTKWVVLAGGDTIIPSREVNVDGIIVNSDYYYSNLGYNWLVNTNGVATLVDLFDWDAEVFVGRLPADTSLQMNNLVRMILDYEKNPPIGSWMKNALFAGTFANFDSDMNGNDILDDEDWISFDTNRNHNWLKTNVLPVDWTSTLLAEREGLAVTNYSYDGALDTSSFIAGVNAGAGIVMADAHGSSFGMARTVFTNDVDQDGLYDFGVDSHEAKSFLTKSSNFNTNGKNGFFWLAACETGTFTDGTCLSEYLARNCAIGCIASFESSYYDPLWYDGLHLGWFTQGLSTRFWQQMLVQGNNQPGMAFSLAKNDYVTDYFAMNGSDDGGRTLTQYNLMGDPEIPIWTDIPLAIEPEIAMNDTSGIVTVRALAGGVPQPNVTVTITSNSYFYNVTTDELGEATLVLPDLVKAIDVMITFSKKNLLPYQELLIEDYQETLIFLLSAIYIPVAFSFALIIIIVIRPKKT